MIQDKGAKYTLGFGISPADVPYTTDPDGVQRQQGAAPNSGFIAKALHGHPIMRFLAVSVGSAVAMGVASKFVKEGGLRLGAKFIQESRHGIDHLADFRKLQHTLDEWEGIHRTFDETSTATLKPYKAIRKAGFFFTETEKAARAERLATGLGTESVAEWTLRDSIQQKLVHQARTLPYALPALYIGNKFATRIGGAQNPNAKRIHWYHPLDAITDFARESVKNTATMLLPWEAGTAGLSHGWQRLMTYGDHVANTTAFQGKLQNFSIDLQGLLRQFGQDASKIINDTTKRSSQVAGSFGTAITEATRANHPWGFVGMDRIKQIQRGIGWQQQLALGAPRSSAFTRGFSRRWDEIAHRDLNIEKIRDGQERYKYKGKWYNTDNTKIVSGEYSSTPLEQFASYLKSEEEPDWDAPSYRGIFAQRRQRTEYMGFVSKYLKDKGVSEEVVSKFANRARVGDLPFYSKDSKSTPRQDVMKRLFFGTGPIHEGVDYRVHGWEQQFAERLEAIVPGHGQSIVNRLQEAVQYADAQYMDPKYQQALRGQIRGDFKDLYQRGLIPVVKEMVPGGKLPHELFDEGMSSRTKEYLLRRTASALGWDIEGVSTSTLRAEMSKAGVDVNNTRALVAHLHDQKALTRPWSEAGGYNILGLRRLSVNDALKRHFFPHDLEEKITDINKRISDPYLKGIDNRPVSNKFLGVWETAGGKIIDLGRLKGGIVRTTDVLSQHVQIPLLHMNPFNLLGYAARRMMSQKPLVQIESVLGTHSGALNIDKSAVDSLVYVRSGKHGKGQVFGHRGIRDGVAESIQRAPGWWRSGPTGGEGMLATNIRLGLTGETGFFDPHKDDPGFKNALKRKLGIPLRQEGNIFNWIKTFRKGEISEWLRWRKGDAAIADINNVPTFARKFLEGAVKDLPADATADEIRAAVVEAKAKGMPRYLSGEQVKAAEGLKKHLGQFNISAKISRQIDQLVEEKMAAGGDNPPLKSLRGLFNVLDPSPLEQIDKDSGEVIHRGKTSIPLSNLRQSGDIYRVIENTLNQHLAMEPNEDLRRQIQSAQGWLRKVWLPQQGVPGALDNIAREGRLRKDEMTADIIRYLSAREDIIAQGGGNDVIQDLLNAVEELHTRKEIGGSEYVETRAAILGLQWNILDRKAAMPKPGSRQVPEAIKLRDNLEALLQHRGTRSVLQDVADNRTKHIHKDRFFGWEGHIRRYAGRHIGAAEPEYEGVTYRPYGGNQRNVYVPTLGTQIKERPVRAIKSALGMTTWSDPDAFSTFGVVSGHLHRRLNRYFSMVGLGVDEGQYKGPQGFLSKGLGLRRVLPAVAGGSGLIALDRTVGSRFHHKDDNGDRQYTPLVTGGLATGFAHVRVALTPGKGRREEKREEYFGDKDVAIRKGRYWPLGNQPWGGTKVMYYRPNWYKRYMSGYKYTDQTFGSPLEHLAFDEDFSPLRPLDPYHFERKHWKDRPYPITGEYFTGPWGPFTSFLNMTAGRILKPGIHMHKKEMAEAMSNMQRVGQYGMAPQVDPDTDPQVITRLPTGGAALLATRSTSELLGQGTWGTKLARHGTEPYDAAYRQPYGFMGMPYGTSPDEALESYKKRKHFGRRGKYTGGGPIAHEAAGNTVSNAMIGEVNAAYEAQAGTPARRRGGGGSSAAMAYNGDPNKSYTTGNDPYNRVLLAQARRFDPRIMAAANPINPRSLKHQAGQSAYEMQEMFGIYGFLAGAAKQGLGLGNHDWHPNQPVLQSASRGYGSERSFWDLNLGGMGDFPTPLEGEYGNIEFSEIARRFIPHRRRAITEVNPIPNQLGQQYPWLPDQNYFLNFHQGDPYTLIPEGEMRLPGPGYERTHTLHPDRTGQYGLLDQHAILGDVAPWSQQYKAVDRILKKAHLSDEDHATVINTRKEVASLNKRKQFQQYKHAHADFQTKDAQIVGFMPGDADTLRTTQGMVKLAGVRARSGPDATDWMQRQLAIGDDVQLTYDANYPPKKDEPLEAIVNASGKNINRELLKHEDLSYASRKNAPLEHKVQENKLQYSTHALAERLGHMNTLVNTKFAPHRTAVEDWERTNVYGSSFPQWEHPYRDFIRPLTYRAMNRNPLVAGTVLAGVGRAFGAQNSQEGKYVGSAIGFALGFGLAFHSDARTIQTGQRFIPRTRKKEMGIEENVDILNYVKYSRLYSEARQRALSSEGRDPEKIAQQVEAGEFKEHQFTNIGPATSQAMQYRKRMQSTMYGADVYGDVINLAAAIPKRKRDHFLEFLSAPVNERARILSTAPRLERRIYEGRWGMKVEQRPDLTSYFENHELPDPGWSGWNPNVNLEDVKLKMVHHQGLDASQMGYYPQQIQQANLTNTPYPDFQKHSSHDAVAGQLRALMNGQGINGNVQMIPSARPGRRVTVHAGVQ